jgi:hypothetical protein
VSTKPSMSVALIGMPHKAPDGGDGEDGASRDDAKDAMDLFIEAVHAKDTEGALKAFESLHDFCAADEDEEEAEEDTQAGERDEEEA